MKKNRELAHLEHFRTICPFFPDGKIEKAEKPDFLVYTGESILGIEHTEIFQPGPSDGTSLQAKDNLGQRVVRKAKELYLQRNSQPLHIQVFFNQKVNIRKKEIDRLAKMVLNLVETTPIVLGEPITLKRTKENAEYFPIEVVMVHIYAHPKIKENSWHSSSAGRIPKLTPEYLQDKINRKELKLDHYNTRCEEIWLLIVADDFRIPSTVDLSELVLVHRYISRFNRVFFFWNSTRRYFELQVTKGQSKGTSI
jgi:hypothetical protein